MKPKLYPKKRTHFINLKEFRQNLTKYTNLVKHNKRRLIVLRWGTPIMEIRPINRHKDLRELIGEKQSPHLYTLSEAIEMLKTEDE